jgi:hypothetical protein
MSVEGRGRHREARSGLTEERGLDFHTGSTARGQEFIQSDNQQLLEPGEYPGRSGGVPGGPERSCGSVVVHDPH